MYALGTCFFSSSNRLIDFLRLKICLKWLISFGIIFSWLLATLQMAVCFNFINRLFFCSLRIVCLFVCVVVLLAKRKICLGVLKKVLFSLSGRKKPMAKICKERRCSKKLPLESCLIWIEMYAGRFNSLGWEPNRHRSELVALERKAWKNLNWGPRLP